MKRVLSLVMVIFLAVTMVGCQKKDVSVLDIDGDEFSLKLGEYDLDYKDDLEERFTLIYEVTKDSNLLDTEEMIPFLLFEHFKLTSDSSLNNNGFEVFTAPAEDGAVFWMIYCKEGIWSKYEAEDVDDFEYYIQDDPNKLEFREVVSGDYDNHFELINDPYNEYWFTWQSDWTIDAELNQKTRWLGFSNYFDNYNSTYLTNILFSGLYATSSNLYLGTRVEFDEDMMIMTEYSESCSPSLSNCLDIHKANSVFTFDLTNKTFTEEVNFSHTADVERSFTLDNYAATTYMESIKDIFLSDGFNGILDEYFYFTLYMSFTDVEKVLYLFE